MKDGITQNLNDDALKDDVIEDVDDDYVRSIDPDDWEVHHLVDDDDWDDDDWDDNDDWDDIF